MDWRLVILLIAIGVPVLAWIGYRMSQWWVFRAMRRTFDRYADYDERD